MFNNIVISGGSMKCLATLGCIKFLEEQDYIKNASRFIGTSAGSIISFFLILGYNFEEMYNFFLNHIDEYNINVIDIEQIFSIFTNYGMNTGSNTEALLKKILSIKLNLDDITFMELGKITGKNLIVCVSNLTLGKPEFFSIDTCPNLSVITAIKASCAIPIIFSPVKINDHFYVDGGIYAHFPIEYLKEDKLRDTFGIHVRMNKIKPDNFLTYILLIIFTIVDKNQNVETQKKFNNVVTVRVDNKNIICMKEGKIKITKELLNEYVEIGYNCIKQKMINDIIF